MNNLTSNSKNNNGRSRIGKILRKNRTLIAGAAVLLPILFLYLFLAFFYHNHFYKNTEINGLDTSNMTVEEAKDAFHNKVKTYYLTLEGRNGSSDKIYGEDIDLQIEFDGISDLLDKQNSLIWPFALFRSHKLEMDHILVYDETLLKKQIKNLEFFDKTNIEEPKNATISEYGENGYEILPEVQGAKVDKNELTKAIQNSITTLEPLLSLEAAECYIEPKITSNSPELKEALKKMEKNVGAKIRYEFGEAIEILDAKQISKWLSVDENAKVILDTDGIKEYVDYLGKTYNTFGRIRDFRTHYGKKIKVKGGDYGWWLNRSEEVSELTKLIQKGKKLTRKPIYYQTAQQYGKDDIGDTYVEVNLTAQHLFFYKDGKLIIESDFVSGNVSKDLGTPTGTYPVQYKDNDATLVGEDYTTPVKYWMPFNKNIGFHDASWRDEFGKNIYLTNGSHGCINMPPAAAKKMFKNIERGVAVIVYELPGTENYDTEEDSSSTEENIPIE